MKKLLLLISVFLISAFSLSSQSLSLSNASGSITNGQTIMVSGDANLVLTAYVYVTNNTSADLDVMVKKIVLYEVPNTINYFCWIQCYPPDVFVSPSPLTIPANSTDFTHFSGDYDALGAHGITKIMYVFFDSQNANDSIAVEIWFNAGTVGVSSPAEAEGRQFKVYPNPAYGQVFVDMNGIETGEAMPFRLFDLNGRMVQETLIKPEETQSIDVQHLDAGIYLYEAGREGNELQRGRLVIR
ncbi:MAG TPA: T9SS type A sorting domain-containing protein [Bacteroidales bacterium]|nr:T9SS type A sorting domain-containing protein [Bacteroidales bacterium]HSA43460.1 T9SS type A sorting domain-containing protein [Bacteroidales bacterium]